MSGLLIKTLVKDMFHFRKIIAGIVSLFLMMSCSPMNRPESPAIKDVSLAFLRLSAKTPEFGTRYRISSLLDSKNRLTGETVYRKLPSLFGATLPPVFRETRFEPVPAGESITIHVAGRIDDRRGLVLYHFNHELSFDTNAGHIYDIAIEIVDHHPGKTYNMIVCEKAIGSDHEKGKEIVINRGFPFNSIDLMMEPMLLFPTDTCIEKERKAN